jgi:hypothetical protein
MKKKLAKEPHLMTDVELLNKARDLIIEGRAKYITVAIMLVGDTFSKITAQQNRLMIEAGAAVCLGDWRVTDFEGNMISIDEWEENARMKSISFLDGLIYVKRNE